MAFYPYRTIRMNLRFTKMHGLGNDFMVIDGIRQSLPETGVPFPPTKSVVWATGISAWALTRC